MQFIDLKAQFKVIEEEVRARIDTVLEHGSFILGPEIKELEGKLSSAEKERDSLAGRLNNPSFVERAKPEAVEKARADHAEKASDAEKYRAALARLG